MMMKKLLIIRFLINPIFLKFENPNSLSSSITPSFNPSIRNSNHAHRCFSAVSEVNRSISPKLISQVIDTVRISKDECRSKLDSMDTRLSKLSIYEILRGLSFEKLPALQFFEWIRDNHSDLYRNADLCSLMVDNCGWLNDFDTMRALLKRLKHENICLNDKAFGFLPVLDSSKACSIESISLVVRVLDEVGGSVRNSGVHGLISMLCVTDCFELAKYVIEITERKVSYYAVLVREKCRRGDTEEAYDLINQMRKEDCEPDSKMYNYILGSLCKNNKLSEALSLLEEMKKTGVESDEITFEIFISNACRLGRMEFASESLDVLMQTGRAPRLSTYAAIVKGYFNAGRYEEAYAYLCDLEVNKRPEVHKMFSLLARLHQKTGNVDAARRIFNEMMEKGLKPDFGYYAKTVNVLRHTGGRDLARDLKKKFSEFRVE